MKLKKGGYFRNLKNQNICFTEPIKKLFLDSCSNCTLTFEDKIFTRVELLRCNNITLIFKKQCYNLSVDLSYDINVKINNKYEDLINLYLTSCMDINITSSGKEIPLKYSMFYEQYWNRFYKKKHIVHRTY